MYRCEICGDKGDVHHIVHTSEGGLDIKLNYMYLCGYHHRGENGPHKNPYTDLKYKLQLQNKYYEILNKDYYAKKELISKLDISINAFKKLTQNLTNHKNGYDKTSIIKTLMGGKIYDEEIDIIEIEINKLQNNFR